ncbi:metalloregulator ArsR/SmtB family transcription factor [Pseudoalteromonas piscicida]|uniref:ArsR family transcriptional regulator n=1 Tax=Pseudoalteromonas piscicida TaxID=43662 RepID=A0ABN5CRT6_PSEO7|nr:metalloregulator ArsR/SmtB family transcription factor [Pseudoalteromonas piscicida]ATD09721.1 ArsR family transcriptional regulator [Pseudoalteromonas piscicida]WPU31625.1 metalloregulator ArsR/SmtB family transcription factor [Pseudoalteromonas piscicida]
MNVLEAIKALSNQTRLSILQNLREPEKHFPPQDEGDVNVDGVCVSSIQEGVGLSQSTTSTYLASLQRAGLVTSKRMGGWTYYKRNEENIRLLLEILGKEL